MTGGAAGRTVDGRFELLERLGSGGMGTVWRARDTALHREVALKEVRPADRSLDPEGPEGSEASRLLRERVLREARALARISHPHVVTIHHIVDPPPEESPYPWLVMELLPGETLQDLLDGGPLTPRETARLGREVLAALRTVHAAGVRHRDIKPANVLLRADRSAVLTDFGIAALQGSATLTATGDFLGSPEYIAPERIRGTDDDPAGDLWSLGMLLYVCVEGHSPLRRAGNLATLAAVLDEPLPPPVRGGPLTPVLQALLVRDPAARPGTDELDRMLAEAEREDAPTATSYAPPQPSQPPHPPTQPAAYGAVPSGTVPPGAAPPDTDGTAPTGTAVPAVRRGGRARWALAGAAAVAVAALLAGGGYLFAQQQNGPERVRDDARAPSEESHRQHPGKDRDPGSAAPSATASEATPSPGTATPSPTEASPSKEAPKPPGARHPVGSWVAQLASVPKTKGVAARTRQQAALKDAGAPVRYVDSDKFASLRPGYWMFYAAGPADAARAPDASAFPNGRAAVSWCRGAGLDTSGKCVGRYLSRSAGDRPYICGPAENGGVTGRCTRT